MQSLDEGEVILKERVTFSNVVNQPILSFGHLLRAGWPVDGQQQCMFNGDDVSEQQPGGERLHSYSC